jgi:hypothetical protein
MVSFFLDVTTALLRKGEKEQKAGLKRTLNDERNRRFSVVGFCSRPGKIIKVPARRKKEMSHDRAIENGSRSFIHGA